MANTPQDLYLEYRNLDVLLANGQKIYGIDVHEYRNYSKTGDIGCSSGKEAYAQLEAKIKAHGTIIGNNTYEIKYPIEGYPNTNAPGIHGEHVTTMFPLWRVFIGKGSPTHIQQAVRLAVAFGLIEGTQAAIQDYCNRNIGLDCSGFVGNYLGGDLMSTSANSYPKTEINNLDNVSAATVIIWVSGVHVAIIDMVDSKEKSPEGVTTSIKCWVAESTADRMFVEGPSDGLNYSDYEISRVQGQSNVFGIKRPIAFKNKKGEPTQGTHTTQVYLGTVARQPLAEPLIY